LQPVSLVESAVTKEIADAPSVDDFYSGAEVFLDLFIAILHAQADFDPVAERKVREFEGFARTHADTRKLGANIRLIRLCGRKLQREVEVLEQIDFGEVLVDLGEVDGGRCWRRGLREICG